MSIAEQTFLKLTKLISDLAGIELSSNRKKMLVNRIANRLRARDIASFEEYCDIVSTDREERQALIESVTTHYTAFFRDEGQFEHLREHLTGLFKGQQRKIRIWSAACSSGEEAYTLAIVALEAAARARVHKADIRILATDISCQILHEAHEGWFPSSSLRMLNSSQRKYFENGPKQKADSSDPLFRANKQLRELLIFRQVNLCEHPLQVPGGIDIIFCRNVLLYFNPITQRKILDAVTDKLKSGGLLYVGASEPVRGLLPEMDAEGVSVFRKSSDSHSTRLSAELCQVPVASPCLQPY